MKLKKHIEDPHPSLHLTKGEGRGAKKIKAIFYIIIILVVLFEIAVRLSSGHAEEHFFGDKIWGFWSIFGLVGCLLLIIVCKGIGHAILMKKEGYYD
ncbi:MAG: hypothetical protein HZA06_04075 [Nitrospirae bacterium]|nr:hypothetical protein [Nitrospirota bacterium]